MADPLSITASVLALIKFSVQVSFLVKQFCDEVSIVDATLAGVLNEVEGFQQVLESMKETFEKDDIKSNLQATGHVGTHWKNLARALQDGTTTLQQLHTLLEAINKTTSVLDKPRRQIRLKNAAEQITIYRDQIKSYRAALQLSLSTVILWNQVTFQKSTEEIPEKILPTLDKLYDEFRSFGALLNAKIEKLESTVAGQSDENDHELKKMSNLRECVRSAADVVSTTSSTLTAEISDKVSVKNGSDFGDVFVKDTNESMLRWMSSNTVYEFEDMEAPFPDPSETSTAVGTEYHSDSDSDIENEMIRALFNDGKKRKEKGDFPAAARLFRNCLTRFSSNTSHASLTSVQSVSTCGFSKTELLELLTDTYSLMESWSEAKLTMLEKLSITERQVGTKDQLYLWDTLHLAGYLMKTNELVEAHLQGRRSLRGFKKLGESGFEGYETCLNFLCHLCKLEGKQDEEEAYFALLGNHQRKLKGSSSDTAPPIPANSDTRRLPENTSISGSQALKNLKRMAALKRAELQSRASSERTDQEAGGVLPISQAALHDYSKTANTDKDKSVGSSLNSPSVSSSKDYEAHHNASPAQETSKLPGLQVVRRKEKPIFSPQSENITSSNDITHTSGEQTSKPEPGLLAEGSKAPTQSPPLSTALSSHSANVRAYNEKLHALQPRQLRKIWSVIHHLSIPHSVTSFNQMLYRLAAEGGVKKGSKIRKTDLAFLENYCEYFNLSPPKVGSAKTDQGWGAKVTIPNMWNFMVYKHETEKAARDAVIAEACLKNITATDQERVVSFFEKRDPFSDKEVCKPKTDLLKQVVARRDSSPFKRVIHVPPLDPECPVCSSILPGLSHKEFSSHVNKCIDERGFPDENTRLEVAYGHGKPKTHLATQPERTLVKTTSYPGQEWVPPMSTEDAASATTARRTNFLNPAQDDSPSSPPLEFNRVYSPSDKSIRSKKPDETWACGLCRSDTIQLLSQSLCQFCGEDIPNYCLTSLNNFDLPLFVPYRRPTESLKFTNYKHDGKMVVMRRVALFGERQCGKTLLAKAWSQNTTLHNNMSILDFFTKKLPVKNGQVRQLDIWDLTSRYMYVATKREIVDAEIHVILLCFDISSPGSLSALETLWKPRMDSSFPSVPLILVGCKRDRRGGEAVRDIAQKGRRMPLSPFAGNKVASKIQARAYFETSAVQGTGLDELFNYIAEAPTGDPSILTASKGKSSGVRKFWSRS